MQTEHPTHALFDAALFIDDLIHARTDYCSRFLVNALLAYAMVGLTTLQLHSSDLN